MQRSNCTPSISFTSSKGSSTSTEDQRSDSGTSMTTLIGGRPGARRCASAVRSCRVEQEVCFRPT